MTLTIETEYEKDGQQIALKTPKMKLLGKHMDDGETRKFVVEIPEVKEWPGKFKNQSILVKDVETDKVIALYLGDQAVGAYKALGSLVKGVVFMVSKDMVTDTKTGGLRPIVVFKVMDGYTPGNKVASQAKEQPTIVVTGDDVTAFWALYAETVPNKKDRSLSQFIGAYMRLNCSQIPLVRTIIEQYEAHQDE